LRLRGEQRENLKLVEISIQTIAMTTAPTLDGREYTGSYNKLSAARFKNRRKLRPRSSIDEPESEY